MRYEEGNRLSCPLHYTLSVLDGKWKPYIIWYLGKEDQPVVFARLREIVPYTITQKVFAQQLKELISDGMIQRITSENAAAPETTIVTYTLTETGRSLWGLLRLLSDWGYVNGDFDRDKEFELEGKRIDGNKILYSAYPPQEQDAAPEAYLWIWGNVKAPDGR